MSACHCLNPRRHSFRGLRWRCGWRIRPRGSSSGRSSDSLLPFVGPAMPSRRLFQTGHQWLSSRLSRTGVRRPFSCAASAPCSLRSGTAPGAVSGKAHSSGTVGDSHPVPFSTSSWGRIRSPGELSRPKDTKKNDTRSHIILKILPSLGKCALKKRCTRIEGRITFSFHYLVERFLRL